MSEDKKHMESDELMRFVLSQGQEEVPAHIWDGISSELDRIKAAESRKTVMLWFRRSAVAVAAAASVAIGIFAGLDSGRNIVPDSYGRDLIAVMETPQISLEAELDAPADIASRKLPYLAVASEEAEKTVEAAESAIKEAGKAIEEAAQTFAPVPENEDVAPSHTAWADNWEDETYASQRKKSRTSIVVSGIAGTNSVQKSGPGPLKRPAMSTAKPKTGVEQKSSESTYGLPVSIGAGVQIGLDDRWSIGVGASYTILTRKFFGTYTHVSQQGVIDESVSSDIRNVQHYIGIPVNAFYNIMNNELMKFYAYAGGAVEKCISDKYDILNTSYIYKGKASGVQLSATAGIGVEFLLGKHLGLYLDPSLRYYFDCGQPKSIRSAQPLMLGFEMGLRINL